MKKFSGKKKIIIAIASLGVFVVAGIISLVLVLAAGQQNVQSNINVTYVSRNVAAQVTAKYWYTGSSKTAMGTTTFNASEQTRTATMSPSAIIELTADNNKVFFEYAFKNLSKDTVFTVDLTNSPKITASGSQTADFTNMNEQYYVSAVEVPVASLGAIELSNTLNVQPIMGQREGQNDTVYIYVVASIDNLSNDAAYNGTFAWEINYLNTTNNPIVTINLDNSSGTPASSSMQVVTGTYGASNKAINMPCVFTVPTKSGKGFAGYYSASSAGTAYISFNGSPVHSNKTTAPADMTASTTLYAQWSDFVVGAQGTLTSVGAGTLVTDGDDKIVTIPDYVTTIDSNAFTAVASAVTIINVPTSVTTISDYAFAGLSDLVEINFNYNASSASGNLTYTGENNLTSIGEYAFQDCTSLETIVFPESVTSFSHYMFDGCTNLHYITAPIYSCVYVSPRVVQSHGYFDELTDVHLTINGTGTTIPRMAFYGQFNIVSLVISASVETIASSAFQECTALASITIPSSVTEIGDSAFIGCSALTSITIPNSVTSIGEYVFGGCTSLTSITIPSSVTSIGDYAFRLCSSLTSITIPNSVTSIGDAAFSKCTDLTSITIGSGVTSIGSDAFQDCTGLTSITIPSSVTSIGSYAFHDCGLTSITLPSSVTSIEIGTFRGCEGLTSITLPSSVTSIKGSAFYACESLTSITIPSSVTEIGDSAFEECYGLTSITIPSSVTSIGSSAFYDCDSLTSITIPSSVTSIGSYAFSGCSNLTSVTFADGTSTWTISSSANGGGTVSTSSWAPSTTSGNATALKTTYYNKYWTKNS